MLVICQDSWPSHILESCLSEYLFNHRFSDSPWLGISWHGQCWGYERWVWTPGRHANESPFAWLICLKHVNLTGTWCCRREANGKMLDVWCMCALISVHWFKIDQFVIPWIESLRIHLFIVCIDGIQLTRHNGATRRCFSIARLQQVWPGWSLASLTDRQTLRFPAVAVHKIGAAPRKRWGMTAWYLLDMTGILYMNYLYPIYKFDDVFSVLAVCHFFSNIPTALKLYRRVVLDGRPCASNDNPIACATMMLCSLRLRLTDS